MKCDFTTSILNGIKETTAIFQLGRKDLSVIRFQSTKISQIPLYAVIKTDKFTKCCQSSVPYENAVWALEIFKCFL